MARTAQVARETKETNISISLNLDGSGQQEIESPVPFFNHMLSAVARHGFFDLVVKATGDIEIDAHHTVEDIGIVLAKHSKKLWETRPGCAVSGVQRCRCMRPWLRWLSIFRASFPGLQR